MTSINCKHYDNCAAPICPMDEDSLTGIWYPDEEICQSRQFATLDWIRKQKLIARKHGSVDGFFSVAMLQALERVNKGITGANPDEPDSEAKWVRDLKKGRDNKAAKREKRVDMLAEKKGKVGKDG